MTDPVHEAAREAIAAIERLLIPCQPVKYQPWNRDAVERGEKAIDCLRAALDAERVPTSITDEMVERAARAHWAEDRAAYDNLTRQHQKLLHVRARAALDAALNGDKR